MLYEQPIVVQLIEILADKGITVGKCYGIKDARTVLAQLNKGLHARQARHLVCTTIFQDDMVIAWLKTKYGSKKLTEEIINDAMEMETEWVKTDTQFDWKAEGEFLIRKSKEAKGNELLKEDILDNLRKKGMVER